MSLWKACHLLAGIGARLEPEFFIRSHLRSNWVRVTDFEIEEPPSAATSVAEGAQQDFSDAGRFLLNLWTKPNFLFTVGLPGQYRLTVQDERYRGGQEYTVFFPISGSLAYGQRTSLELILQMTGEPDTSPVTATVDPLGTGERFDGWGGNYVFNISSPVTDRLLQELRVSWARVGMSLREWEPANDNSDPTSIGDSYFEQRVASSATLRNEFEMARRLKQMGLPWIASVWYLPGWLQPQGDGSKVPRQNWSELEECVGSYLLYAKRHYGVEADYFSFNESDLGVYALFSPEEHDEAIHEFGKYFQAHGLRTKMLVGDAASASNPDYVTPAVSDPQILDHGGAVAFHTWGGTTPENYLKWRESARRLGVPLLATEVGSATDARHYPETFWKFSYALDDLENYFDVLTWARPRAALLWELTSDYPLIEMSGGEMRPMPRFWFVKQLANLTPAHTEYLSIDSSSENVRIIAFRGGGDPTDAGVPYVVHIANFGPARSLELKGLPGGFRSADSIAAARRTSSSILVRSNPQMDRSSCSWRRSR